MTAPTLFRRLVVAQLLTSFALLLLFGAVFYVERNRTVARLTAERWAPALRQAAHLPAPAGAAAPAVQAVSVATARPAQALGSHAWAPRIAMLRATLREEGVPAGEIVFAPGPSQELTWIEVALPDRRPLWLGFDDEVIEAHVVARLVLAVGLGFVLISAASGAVARRLTRPLDALRRRIATHEGAGRDSASPAATEHAARAGTTLEIDAIDHAWNTLVGRLAGQESERVLLLAGVSHDLRSPLARIRMAAELLPETEGVAVRRASIVRNVDVADRLVDSFLDYVRASELPLASTVDLTALAERVLAMRDDGSDQLALIAPTRLDVSRTHELLLERLLGNLVDNALRHGRPPVLVRLRREGDDALLDVEDRGPGIPPAARARLMQAFARGDEARGTPGVGLGLAIVQQIVRRMGGTLTFESDASGARVRVRLPTG